MNLKKIFFLISVILSVSNLDAQTHVTLDWEVIKAYSNGAAVDAKLKTYMQALRDLPASAKPTTDDAGNLVEDSVTWPTRES